MNVGLPSETIKNAAICIKELEREVASLNGENMVAITGMRQALDYYNQGKVGTAVAIIANTLTVIDNARKSRYEEEI